MRSLEYQSEQKSTNPSSQKFYGATVHGALDGDLLSKPLSVSMGRNSKMKRGTTLSTTVEGLIEVLAEHITGSKEGGVYLQGELHKGAQRKASSLKHMHLAVLDVDNGYPMDLAVEALEALNLMAILYSTHSSYKTVTELAIDDIQTALDLAHGSQITIDQVRAFLIDEQGLWPGAAQDLSIRNQDDVTGVLIVEYNPLEKYRIVTFLLDPFEIPMDDSAARSAAKRWKSLYLGLADWLGVPVDEACSDLARIFYFPRHAAGSPYRVDIVAGDLLDLRVVPKRADKVAPGQKRHAEATADVPDWLRKLVAKFGNRLECADLLMDYGVNPRDTGSGTEAECPNEQAHSRNDDAARPFFARNASQSHNPSGFTMGCQHSHCKAVDRLAFLNLLVAENDLSEPDVMAYVADFDEAAASGDTHRQSDNAPADNAPLDVWLSHLNTLHGIVPSHGKTWIAHFRGAVPIQLMTKGDFLLFYANRFAYEETSNGRKRVNVAKAWLEWSGRRAFEAMGFEPGNSRPSFLNTWVGYSVAPIKGNWSLLLTHIRDVICRGDETLFDFVMTWMADIIQNPGDKKGSALVIRGEKGTGKTFFLDALRELIGPSHSLKVDKAEAYVGRFNSHIEQCLLLQVEEAFWAGNKEGEGALKNLITSGELLIEGKGRDAVLAKNFARLAITTNELSAVPASAGERRFCVLEADPVRKGDIAYFADMHEQLTRGGYQAMMYDLMTFVPKSDLGWNVLRQPPATEWLQEQIDHAAPTVERFVDWLIEEGGVEHFDDIEAQPKRTKAGKVWSFQPNQLLQHYVRWCVRFGIKNPQGLGSPKQLMDALIRKVPLAKTSGTERDGCARKTYYDVVGDWPIKDG